MCGEQHMTLHVRRDYDGSPPRVRGTVSTGLQLPDSSRITPACAGNRLEQERWHRRSRDHPRVCGEQVPRKYFYKWENGSPPRVRGTVHYKWASVL